MPRIFVFLVTLVVRVVQKTCGSRADLILENVALRHQIEVLERRRRGLGLTRMDRVFWVLLRRSWPGWKRALEIVKPDTVERWRRSGIRALWGRRRSRRRGGRPRIHPEIRELIQRMGRQCPLWGAPRVHGELLMLGIGVSERSVSRYLPARPRNVDAVRRWVAFLSNHREYLGDLPAHLAVALGVGAARGVRMALARIAVSPLRIVAWAACRLDSRLREAFSVVASESERDKALGGDCEVARVVASLPMTAAVCAQDRIGRQPARRGRDPPQGSPRAAGARPARSVDSEPRASEGAGLVCPHIHLEPCSGGHDDLRARAALDLAASGRPTPFRSAR